jgi:hypothetical protein
VDAFRILGRRMPPMAIRPPPCCRTFSDRYVSRATLKLGMGPHSFDPPHVKAHKALLSAPRRGGGQHPLLMFLLFCDVRADQNFARGRTEPPSLDVGDTTV